MFFGEAWLQRLFHGALKKSAARCSEHPRRRRERRLTSQVEVLESRSLPTGLGLISGTVFDDLTGNGLSADDPVLAAVAVSLYRDGGNNTFDAGGGDDVLVGTNSTDALGYYEFEFLSAGRYFVSQAAVAGHQQHAGASVVTQLISAADALGVPHALIDDFSTTSQTTSVTTAVRTRSCSASTWARIPYASRHHATSDGHAREAPPFPFRHRHRAAFLLRGVPHAQSGRGVQPHGL